MHFKRAKSPVITSLNNRMADFAVVLCIRGFVLFAEVFAPVLLHPSYKLLDFVLDLGNFLLVQIRVREEGR